MIIEGLGPSFCQQVRAYRQRYHVSQRALASLIGVTVYTLRGWENGTLAPTLDSKTLHRLCQVFDADLPALRGENT